MLPPSVSLLQATVDRLALGGCPLSVLEGRRLEGVIAELESRLAEADRSAEALRRLRDLVITSPAGFDSLAFEERRLALRAVGFQDAR